MLLWRAVGIVYLQLKRAPEGKELTTARAASPAGSSWDGLGLDRDYIVSLAGLLPATRFAVEAYVHFVREKTLLEAVASSLTELFSPQIIGERLERHAQGLRLRQR